MSRGARTSWPQALVVADDELRAALASVPDLELVSPLGGVPIACRDVRAHATAARRRGVLLACDLTLCAGACPALRLGASLAWVGLGTGESLLWACRDATSVLGPLLRARPAGKAEEGVLAAREGRWRASSDAAQVVAHYLACHPGVSCLRYPGLRGDPSFETAARTLMGGFGPLIDWRDDPRGPWHRLVCDERDPYEQVMALEAQLSGR
ncbi:PLP-dependent transferase [Olsenella sp. HMSC062G07]|uniref:PLP-dependent transferase n=1 Tax=Olsenella sp. HMSC062G07 TaxID=1739330 RepID=UPI0008A3FAE1|nr:PLP-dependent transferase [Olsenella sp. HMSC062G07]OFK24352.1 hypothetical protein HMPREF2826_07950 [Olsenella sp. HMSC062G07]